MDKLRLKITVAIAERDDIDLIIAGNNGLFAAAIAAVTAVFALRVVLGIARMIVHLSVKGTLYNTLLEVGK